MIKAAAKLGASGPGRMAIPDLEDLGAAAPGSCRRYQPAKRSPSVRANTPLTLRTRRAAACGLTQHYLLTAANPESLWPCQPAASLLRSTSSCLCHQ